MFIALLYLFVINNVMVYKYPLAFTVYVQINVYIGICTKERCKSCSDFSLN